MDADGRFVQPGHRADFARRIVAVVTEHEHGALTAVETIDRGSQPGPALAGEQARFRIRIGSAAKGGQRFLEAVTFLGRHEPPITPGTRLATVETAVDENPREPDFERPGLPIRANVTEHLDERVLDRFVRFGGIPQVLIRDSRGTALMGGDEPAEALARLVQRASVHETANVDRQARIVGEYGRRGAAWN